MNRFRWLWLVLLGWLAIVSAPGRAQDVTDAVWHDAARNRDVPVRIYVPASGTPPFPVIVFSHGLGGSREGYSYLGKYWSAHGYVSVHVQHLGSDSAVATSPGTMKAAMADPANYANRPKDISFAIDRLTALNQEAGPLQGKLDLARLGVAGHSFGAYTTMAIAGASYRLFQQGLADSRVKAVVAMSIPHLIGENFSTVRVPALHFTGTEDKIHVVANDDVHHRRDGFDQSPGPDTYLVIFQGGDHMVFSGRPLLFQLGRADQDKRFQDLVCRGSTAFWDAYLKGDAQAKAWLADGDFAAALGTSATFEKK